MKAVYKKELKAYFQISEQMQSSTLQNRMRRQEMKHREMQHWKVRYMAFMQGKILFIRMEEPEQSIRKTP